MTYVLEEVIKEDLHPSQKCFKTIKNNEFIAAILPNPDSSLLLNISNLEGKVLNSKSITINPGATAQAVKEGIENELALAIQEAEEQEETEKEIKKYLLSVWGIEVVQHTFPIVPNFIEPAVPAQPEIRFASQENNENKKP